MQARVRAQHLVDLVRMVGLEAALAQARDVDKLEYDEYKQLVDLHSGIADSSAVAVRLGHGLQLEWVQERLRSLGD